MRLAPALNRRMIDTMNAHDISTVNGPDTPIFVVSGGTGMSGELLARTVLAQFQNSKVPIVLKPHIHIAQQATQVVEEAQAAGGLIIHTLVERSCRYALAKEAQAAGVVAIDLVGPLLEYLTKTLTQEPLGQPGLYRRLNETYFKRIEAIEFAVAHDDGKRIDELPQSDLVLLGVSRVGKTPLSVYLSLRGWKVANVPFVLGIPLPETLGLIDRRRVFGLTSEPYQLAQQRRTRQSQLGIQEGAYFDRTYISEEIRAANHTFYQHGFAMIDVTDKPIETIADELESLLHEPVTA